ncbi:MAG: Fe-S cluster assembly protein SufD, partial [Clostridia bacterium]|nr:Fe-S cluster assembly protein SufD [Clostridia bacterium]
HAASSGRLDEDVMFYILSRGISEEDARKLVAKASFDVILEDIPDERIREEIMAAVEESIDRRGE